MGHFPAAGIKNSPWMDNLHPIPWAPGFTKSCLLMMYRAFGLMAVLFFLVFPAKGKEQSGSGLRISLLTCGTGPEVWETFGHTALRVVDSAAGTDLVYNYGTFAFSDDFAWQFAQGKLDYSLSVYPYIHFLSEYERDERSVDEQLLLLSADQAHRMQAFLDRNALPEYRDYKYDFFYDNCATRIRDIFPEVFGQEFRFGSTVAAENALSFRDIINRYYYYKHWERLGINLLLGSPIDRIMTNEDILFLPDYLSEGVGRAEWNGQPVSGTLSRILEGRPPPPPGWNIPSLVFVLSLALLVLGLGWAPLRSLGQGMIFLHLFVSGILGWIMVIMWFFTDHQACAYNSNLLWALPTNLFLAFLSKTGRSRYAYLALGLMGLGFLLHLLGVQKMPLTEITPWLLSLVFVYGYLIRIEPRAAAMK